MSFFKDKVLGRLREPSSMAGVATVLVGINQMFDVNEVGKAADVINQAAQQPSWLGAIITALGAAAIIFREKGNTNAK